MIHVGDPALLGATLLEDGCNFAIQASTATRIELCLFDRHGGDIGRFDLPGKHCGVWHGFVPGLGAGTCYGYRVHGPWKPEKGLRHNPAKLLIDPYARLLHGDFKWSPAVFGYKNGNTNVRDDSDSAPFVPKSVVVDRNRRIRRHPLRPWRDTIIYETNVRGYTMRHPALSADERGRFRGLANGEIIGHLKALGITAIELMPVHAFIDEHFLEQKGLRNSWGYNTINFFSPMPRYAGDDPIAEFREMVQALHDANIEVILDVVYNHTAEGDERGPTLSFRGIDNASYYRLLPESPSSYINDAGTGNTINADQPVVQDLVLDSLRYWYTEMGVDGFRFDLAPILGRYANGFSSQHPLLQRIAKDKQLKHSKLIAEPWDIGPGGYQLGGFPPGWAEWNDRFRDTARQFWRGDERQAPALARRLHGSADLFEGSGRPPQASVNFITSHDGFTLRDLVSYASPHNLANGENNRDGHQHNYSMNHGAEGETDDAEINALRQRQQVNMLATVLLSQGTPMLLAGDEFSNTQSGNNNAYAQDNEISWIDWSDKDAFLLEQTRQLIDIRAATPLLRQRRYRHGLSRSLAGQKNIEWLTAAGTEIEGVEWHHTRSIAMLLCATPQDNPTSDKDAAFMALFNSAAETVSFTLPAMDKQQTWSAVFNSGTLKMGPDNVAKVGPHSIVCLRWPKPAGRS